MASWGRGLLLRWWGFLSGDKRNVFMWRNIFSVQYWIVWHNKVCSFDPSARNAQEMFSNQRLTTIDFGFCAFLTNYSEMCHINPLYDTQPVFMLSFSCQTLINSVCLMWKTMHSSSFQSYSNNLPLKLTPKKAPIIHMLSLEDTDKMLRFASWHLQSTVSVHHPHPLHRSLKLVLSAYQWIQSTRSGTLWLLDFF